MTTIRTVQAPAGLPARLAPHFWEYRFSRLSWEKDRDLIISRVLAAGGWDDLRWLLERLGRHGLREWIKERNGRGLDPRRLRFWELILGIPHHEVSRWIQAAHNPWLTRAGA